MPPPGRPVPARASAGRRGSAGRARGRVPRPGGSTPWPPSWHRSRPRARPARRWRRHRRSPADDPGRSEGAWRAGRERWWPGDHPRINPMTETSQPSTPAAPEAVIVAGGFGTRLLPLTARRPKHLLDVGGVPFLEHQIARLAEAGVEHIVLATPYHAALFAPVLGAGRRWGVQLGRAAGRERVGQYRKYRGLAES